jgi:hypothetical protein
VGYHTRIMEPTGPLMKLFRGRPKKMLDDYDPELDAPARGPLYSRPVLRALLILFGISLMLCVDWFGLLLLNSEGVIRQMGPLNAVRITGALLGGVAITSVPLMVHYRRVYSYISEENIFFAITFSISFMLGMPCALVGLFG